MTITEIRPETYHAIRAATLYRTCGRWAAMLYAKKHNVVGLYRLCRQLEAMKGV